MLSEAEKKEVRSILYVSATNQIITSAEHDLINAAVVADNIGSLNGNKTAIGAVEKMQRSFSPSPSALAKLRSQLGDAPAAPPQAPPTPPAVPPAPESGVQNVRVPVALTDDEVLTVRHMNYEARREYRLLETNKPLYDRFMVMTDAMHAKRSWSDADPGTLLGMMTQTTQGKYWTPLIKRYAAEVGITIKDVTPPGSTPVPVPEQPPVPPATTPQQNEQLPPEWSPLFPGIADQRRTPIKSFASGAAFAKEVLDVIQHNTVRFDQRVGFGADPIQNAEARITLMEGQIIGVSKSNFQNDDEQGLPEGVVPHHANTLDIANSDGGIRGLQYQWFWLGRQIRNTLNRIPAIFAMFDSRGEHCISGDEKRAPGQLFYTRFDYGRKEIKLSAFGSGWTLSLRRSDKYGGEEIDIIDEKIERALRARGL